MAAPGEELMETYMEVKAEGTKCTYSALLSEFQNQQEPEVQQQANNNQQQTEARDELPEDGLKMIMDIYTQRCIEAKAKGITCKYSTVLSELQSHEPRVRQQQSNKNQQIEAHIYQECRPKNNFDSNQEEQVIHRVQPRTTFITSETIEKFESTTITTLAITTTTTTSSSSSKHKCYFDGITIPRKRRTPRIDVSFEMQEKPPQRCEPVPEQQDKMKEIKNANENKKRKERLVPSPSVPKSSSKRQKKDTLPAPEPEMPVHIREAINSLGGTLSPLWVDEKKLTKSDIDRVQTRLFFPRCVALEKFMTKPEIATHTVLSQTKKEGKHRNKPDRILPLIDPRGEERNIDFRIWPSLEKSVFTSHSWMDLVRDFRLKEDSDTLQIWAFRLPPERDSKLCFAVNLVRRTITS